MGKRESESENKGEVSFIILKNGCVNRKQKSNASGIYRTSVDSRCMLPVTKAWQSPSLPPSPKP